MIDTEERGRANAPTGASRRRFIGWLGAASGTLLLAPGALRGLRRWDRTPRPVLGAGSRTRESSLSDADLYRPHDLAG